MTRGPVRRVFGTDVPGRDIQVPHATLYSLVANRAAANPRKTAFTLLGAGSLNYGALINRALAAASFLVDRGIGPGDRVLLMGNNRVEFVDLFLACARIGAVFVPFTPGLRGKILCDMVELADPAIFIAEEEWRDRVEEAWQGATFYLPGTDVETSPWPSPPTPPLLPPEPDPTALCLLLFTSGTTGRSKGVMWAHATVNTMAFSLTAMNGITKHEVMHTALPIAHGNGLILTVYAALIMGASTVVSRRFSASAFDAELAASGATITNLLGAMSHIVLAQPEFEHSRPVLAKALVIPVDPEIQAAIERRYGCTVYSVYGLSDAGLPLLTGPSFPPGSCGRLLSSLWEAKLVHPDGSEAPPGKAGELWVRGRHPRSMAFGYWRMPKETADRYRDGWVATGDLFKVEDGWFYFLDRAKDAIRRRGENVSSQEVESAVAAHPAVKECAVYAVPSDMSEDEVMTAVVLKEGATLAPLDLIKFVEGRLPYFAVPRYVIQMTTLPMTDTNKVQKAELKRIGITPDTWDLAASDYKLSR